MFGLSKVSENLITEMKFVSQLKVRSPTQSKLASYLGF